MMWCMDTARVGGKVCGWSAARIGKACLFRALHIPGTRQKRERESRGPLSKEGGGGGTWKLIALLSL